MGLMEILRIPKVWAGISVAIRTRAGAQYGLLLGQIEEPGRPRHIAGSIKIPRSLLIRDGIQVDSADRASLVALMVRLHARALSISSACR
jgi:hypothetical protein